MRKSDRYLEYMKSLIKRTFSVKTYLYHKTKIKYIFQKDNKSETLIVVFSACTRKGVPARYNYMRTLDHIQCNKLFALDDFGKDSRGGYYIGEYPEYEFEQGTKCLIDQVIAEHGIKKVLFCGSSKGGWAALNFGVQYNENHLGHGIIVGAPQFWLGKYLSGPANQVTLESISGKYDPSIVAKELDDHLKNAIEEHSANRKQKIYIHYSKREHTYIGHIFDLIGILQNQGYEISENVASYTEHGDVSLFFPGYLVRTVKEIL